MEDGTREGITLGIALLGAGLGLVNAWRAISRDRIRVRVEVRVYMDSRRGRGLCVEVTNLGCVPVTVAQVGFGLATRGEVFVHSGLLAGLPKRLEPRAALTAFLPAGVDKDPLFSRVRCAYATTACGLRFRGGRRSLRKYFHATYAAAVAQATK